jgi:bacteriocin biosynthesis cyclodehydratase domain-containing protein
VGGANAARYVDALLADTQEAFFDADALVDGFPAEERATVRELIAQLTRRGFLSASGAARAEGPDDVFYWHFGKTAEDVAALLARRTVAILGVNYAARSVAQTLIESGCTPVVIDLEPLRNLALYDGTELRTDRWPAPPPIAERDWAERAAREPRCVVIASDGGGRRSLRDAHRRAFAAGDHVLPVLLNNLVGTVGPFVVPGETPCYECACTRENSNRAFSPLDDREAAELSRFAGFHPAMASLLGTVAAFELVKFYAGIPRTTIGSAIEVNLLAGRMVTHRILRVPRCALCNPRFVRSAANPQAPLPVDPVSAGR